MNLSGLEIFSEVYRAGSFSVVARQRDVSPSAVSRAIAALEAELGVLLFYRTTRSISPTEAATLLVNKVDTHIEALQSIKTMVTDTRETANGLLRISASHSFGVKMLGPLIPKFRAQYPDINIELSLSDRVVDIVAERFDVAIRHGPLADSSLVAKTVLHTHYYACASPAYLRKHPSVKKVQDIGGLRCLTFLMPGFGNVWRFKDNKGRISEVPIHGALSANSGMVLRENALKGEGVVLLSDWLIGKDLASGKLIDLFPKLKASPSNFQTAISAVYPNRKHIPKKVEVFVDFLQENLSGS